MSLISLFQCKNMRCYNVKFDVFFCKVDVISVLYYDYFSIVCGFDV